MARSEIACNDDEPEAPEMSDGEILAERAQGTTAIALDRRSAWRRAFMGHASTLGQKM